MKEIEEIKQKLIELKQVGINDSKSDKIKIDFLIWQNKKILRYLSLITKEIEKNSLK